MKFFGAGTQPEIEVRPGPAGENPKGNKEKTPHYKTSEEEILETYKTKSVEKLKGGVNLVQLLELEGDGSAIFKPQKGEVGARLGFESALYKRERAAYLVDRFFGLNLVPSTIIREIKGEIGSVQQFIPDAKEGMLLTQQEFQSYKEDLKKLWIFDYIIWNADRHSGNFIFKDNKLYAIDHGMAFAEIQHKAHWYEAFFDEPIPQDLIESFERLYPYLDDIKKQSSIWDDNERLLKEMLLELLENNRSVDACLGRMRLIRIFLRRYKGLIPKEVKDKLTY